MTFQPLPEDGAKSDFKRAFLKTIPPRPFYHRRSIFQRRNLIYCLITNGLIGLNNLISFAVNVYCQDITVWSTVSTLGVTLLEILLVIWTYRSTEKAENSLEQSFYKFVETLSHLELCQRNSPDTFIEVLNTHRLMANMLRRKNRTLGTALNVWAYNLLHRKTRKCNTCLQIQHGYRHDRCEFLVNKKWYKFENCPFCGWDY